MCYLENLKVFKISWNSRVVRASDKWIKYSMDSAFLKNSIVGHKFVVTTTAWGQNQTAVTQSWH